MEYEYSHDKHGLLMTYAAWQILNSESKTEKINFKPGETITSIEELLQQDTIYCGSKQFDSEWFKSWSVDTAMNRIKSGAVKKAIRLTNEEYYKPEADAAYKKWLSEEVK